MRRTQDLTASRSGYSPCEILLPPRARSTFRRRLRRRVKAIKRRSAQHLTAAVVVLHLVMLLALELTGPWDPPRVPLFELLWAGARRPTIQLAVLVVLITPVATMLAWLVKGKHRWLLAASWLVLGLVLATRFPRRVEVIMNVLWWRYG